MRGRLASVALPIRYAERRNGRRKQVATVLVLASLLVVRSYLDVGRQKNPKSESHGLILCQTIGFVSKQVGRESDLR